MTNSGLTKLCTFTPYYMIDNKSKAPIEVADANAMPHKQGWSRVSGGTTTGRFGLGDRIKAPAGITL